MSSKEKLSNTQFSQCVSSISFDLCKAYIGPKDIRTMKSTHFIDSVIASCSPTKVFRLLSNYAESISTSYETLMKNYHLKDEVSMTQNSRDSAAELNKHLVIEKMLFKQFVLSVSPRATSNN